MPFSARPVGRPSGSHGCCHLWDMLPYAPGLTVPAELRAQCDLIRKNVVPGGTTRNIEAADGFTRWGSDLTDVDRTVLSDAQTSGGLLIAVASSRVADLVEELRVRETPVAAVVGEVVEKGARQVEVVAQGDPASRRERADL